MTPKQAKNFIKTFKARTCPDFRFTMINNLFHDWACNLEGFGKDAFESTMKYDKLWREICNKLPAFNENYFITEKAWLEYVSQQTIHIAEMSNYEIDESFYENTMRSLSYSDAVLLFPFLEVV